MCVSLWYWLHRMHRITRFSQLRMSKDVPLTSYKPLFSPSLLEGKAAFVTGGGSGIGFRIAELLMRHGTSHRPAAVAC